MKPNLLVVEDNTGILFNLEITLTTNNYNVVTTRDGKEGLEVLSRMDPPPDLIISDIMMPRMDGYEFFEAVSKNPEWRQIPFIFLTAKSFPDDVRFGKMLGVDDYITKPFQNKDLLAVVAGKISRSLKNRAVRKQVEEDMLALLSGEQLASFVEDNRETPGVLLYINDEESGPVLRAWPPGRENLHFPLEFFGINLFSAMNAAFGLLEPEGPQGVQLVGVDIRMDAYVLFDEYEDREGRKHRILLAALAPGIDYLESSRVNEIFMEWISRMKDCELWDMKDYWEKITRVLLKSEG